MVSRDDVAAVEIARELSASPSSTTPEEILLRLHTNLDHVRVDAYLTDIYANPISGCQSADIYRIGNAAVSWPVGDTHDVPLSYEQVLEPGLYVQKVAAYCDLGEIGRITHRRERYFEVTGAGMQPMGGAEYLERLDAGLYDYAREPSVPPAIPCDEPPPPSDEVAPADATSSVDIDSWVNVSTRQPWRWVRAECAPYMVTTRHSLDYHAQNAAGQHLSVGISFVPEEPARAFEASGEWNFVPHGLTDGTSMRLVLEEADGTGWELSSASNVRVQQGEGDQLLVTLSDVVLQSRMTTTEPVVTRTIGTGRIMGRLISEAVY